MFETIKNFIIIILAAGLVGAIGALVALWKNFVNAKNEYLEAAEDGMFTDDEYIILGKELVSAIENGKTIWAFIKTLMAAFSKTVINAKLSLRRRQAAKLRKPAR
jgi:hypothetical protein